MLHEGPTAAPSSPRHRFAVAEELAGWTADGQELLDRGQIQGPHAVIGPDGRAEELELWPSSYSELDRQLLLFRRRTQLPGRTTEPILTPRKREILELLAAGLTAPAISKSQTAGTPPSR